MKTRNIWPKNWTKIQIPYCCQPSPLGLNIDRCIRSKETCRSWERCRNKRYRQAKQHRERICGATQDHKKICIAGALMYITVGHISRTTQGLHLEILVSHLTCTSVQWMIRQVCCFSTPKGVLFYGQKSCVILAHLFLRV